ncbi:unnamed protein product [Calypogeia fissa]
MEGKKRNNLAIEGEGETGMTLPVELVERILAMVPFPFIFKARALSKSWLARLSSISSSDDKETKRLGISFQEQVGQFAKKWKTFCPIFVHREGSIGYDRTSQRWRTIMPSFSFLPDNFYAESGWSRMEGSLVLVSTKKSDEEKDSSEDPDDFNENVVNILTRRYEQLPSPPPGDYRTHMGQKLAIPMTSQMYKVVIFHDTCHSCFVDVFDSESRIWRNAKVEEWERFRYIYLSNWAHLNGTLYNVIAPTEDTRDLLAFNVEERTFNLLQMPAINMPPLYSGLVALRVVNANLLMVVFDPSCEGVTVMKIDVRSRRWLYVTHGPPANLNFGRICSEPAVDGDCIYFMGKYVDTGFLVYEMETDEWSLLPFPESALQSLIGPTEGEIKPEPEFHWDATCFQPGLNPFVAI